MASLSASTAVTDSETWPPSRTEPDDCVSAVIAGEWSGPGAGPVPSGTVIESGTVCPATTTVEPLPLPTCVGPAKTVAVTVCDPAGALSVPEKVPPVSRVRSTGTLAGVTVTDTRVISAPDVCAVTVTWTNRSEEHTSE